MATENVRILYVGCAVLSGRFVTGAWTSGERGVMRAVESPSPTRAAASNTSSGALAARVQAMGRPSGTGGIAQDDGGVIRGQTADS
jgi:hypothetical protein